MSITTNLGTIYRGEDITLNFTMDPVVDISGWTLAYTIRDKHLTGSALASSVGTVTSGASGTFTVPITAAQSAAIDPGNYSWDVWRTDSGSASLLAHGDIIVAGSPRVP